MILNSYWHMKLLFTGFHIIYLWSQYSKHSLRWWCLLFVLSETKSKNLVGGVTWYSNHCQWWVPFMIMSLNPFQCWSKGMSGVQNAVGARCGGHGVHIVVVSARTNKRHHNQAVRVQPDSKCDSSNVWQLGLAAPHTQSPSRAQMCIIILLLFLQKQNLSHPDVGRPYAPVPSTGSTVFEFCTGDCIWFILFHGDPVPYVCTTRTHSDFIFCWEPPTPAEMTGTHKCSTGTQRWWCLLFVLAETKNSHFDLQSSHSWVRDTSTIQTPEFGMGFTAYSC